MPEDGAPGESSGAAASPGPPSARTTGTGMRQSTTGQTPPHKPNSKGPPALALSPVGGRKDAKDKDKEAKDKDGEHTSVVMQSDHGATLIKAEKPDERVVNEIVGCLKMRNSMLAMGACERVKKIARAYPVEVANSAIMQQLLGVIKDDPASALSGAVMQALSIMSLNPEGRQKVCLAGGAVPLISFIRAADMSKANLDRAVTLLMNLAADQGNRRMLREEGAVEALAEVLKVAPVGDPAMEHALGALHNIALLDAKAKARAIGAGILHPLVRTASTRGLPDSDMCVVRSRMVLTELLKLPDTEAKLAAVAQELGVRL